MYFKHFILLLTLSASVTAQLYEDNRCRCICPTPKAVVHSTTESQRTLYVAYVPPNKCNCDNVILPKVEDEVRLSADLFCSRCECQYETRNTTVIMVVVIFIIWVIILLLAYYMFLLLLEALMSLRPHYDVMLRRKEETVSLLTESEDVEDLCIN